jgi:hypothetical protein
MGILGAMGIIHGMHGPLVDAYNPDAGNKYQNHSLFCFLLLSGVLSWHSGHEPI